jgi:hypothetical protein
VELAEGEGDAVGVVQLVFAEDAQQGFIVVVVVGGGGGICCGGGVVWGGQPDGLAVLRVPATVGQLEVADAQFPI